MIWFSKQLRYSTINSQTSDSWYLQFNQCISFLR